MTVQTRMRGDRICTSLFICAFCVDNWEIFSHALHTIKNHRSLH